MKEQNNQKASNNIEQNLPPKDHYHKRDDEPKEYKCHFCCQVTIWILQTLIWILLIASIILYFYDVKTIMYPFVFSFLFCSYIVYILSEFLNPSFKYFINKISEEELNKIIYKYTITVPVIELSCYSSHEEYCCSLFIVIQKVTHSETIKFPFYSVTDATDAFYLNKFQDSPKKIKYVKLELIEDINFSDKISFNDYKKMKNGIIKRNNRFDVSIKYNEKREIPGMKHHYLIKIGETKNCNDNLFFYIVSVLLGLCEFYKLYFNPLCGEQTFKIKKLITTRNNQNQPQSKNNNQNFSQNKIQPKKNEIKKSQQFQNQNSENYKIDENNDEENNEDNINDMNNGIDLPLIKDGKKGLKKTKK